MVSLVAAGVVLAAHRPGQCKAARDAPRMESSRGPPAGRAALIDWFERSTKQHLFIEGAAATNLAAEGQVPGAFGRQPGGWGRGADVGRYVNFPRLSLTARPHGRNQLRPTAAVRPPWGGGLAARPQVPHA